MECCLPQQWYCFITVSIVFRLLAVWTLLRPSCPCCVGASPYKRPCTWAAVPRILAVAFPHHCSSLFYQQAVAGCLSTTGTILGCMEALFVGVTSRWDCMCVLISNTNASSCPPASLRAWRAMPTTSSVLALGGGPCEECHHLNELLVWADKDNFHTGLQDTVSYYFLIFNTILCLTPTISALKLLPYIWPPECSKGNGEVI